MIFSGELCGKVMDGTKTVTRREIKHGQPCRYEVGKTYAVQPKRGQSAVGRIEVTAVDRIHISLMNVPEAQREGFDTPDDFYDRWEAIYGHLHSHVWRIEFKLVTVSSGRAANPKDGAAE